MSNTSKTVLSLIVIAIIVGGLWVISNKPASNVVTNTNQTPSTTNSNSSPATGSSVSNANDTSDTAIASNANAIDAQMNGLSSDWNNTTPASDNQ